MSEYIHEVTARGSDQFPFELYHCPVEKPWRFGAHWQEDMEIFCVTDGKIEMFLDGQTLVLNTGDVVFINPGQIHGYRQLGAAADYDAYVFPLEHLLFSSEDNDQLDILRPLADGKVSFPLYLPDDPLLQQLVQRIVEVNTTMEPGFQLLTKTYLLQLIIGLSRHQAFIVTPVLRHSDICRNILRFIQHHYSEKISVPDIAAAVGLSPTYFSAFFTQHFSQCFSDYLCTYRIAQSCLLLDSTSLSVTEVALAVGFSSGSYFIQCFRRVKGITPAAYRDR
jgi:AraC-like DNA-binding protein